MAPAGTVYRVDPTAALPAVAPAVVDPGCAVGVGVGVGAAVAVGSGVGVDAAVAASTVTSSTRTAIAGEPEDRWVLTAADPAARTRASDESEMVCCHEVGWASPSIQTRALSTTGDCPDTESSARTF